MAFRTAPLSSSWIVPRVTIGRVTPFIPREGPNVKHSIPGYSRLPLPTPAPALMRVLHWLRCWAEEPGYATAIPPKDYGQIRGGCSFPWMIAVDYSDSVQCRTAFNSPFTIPNDPLRMGAKSTTPSNNPSTPSNIVHSANVVSMLCQRRRLWSNIKTALGQSLVWEVSCNQFSCWW